MSSCSCEWMELLQIYLQQKCRISFKDLQMIIVWQYSIFCYEWPVFHLLYFYLGWSATDCTCKRLDICGCSSKSFTLLFTLRTALYTDTARMQTYRPMEYRNHVSKSLFLIQSKTADALQYLSILVVSICPLKDQSSPIYIKKTFLNLRSVWVLNLAMCEIETCLKAP